MSLFQKIKTSAFFLPGANEPYETQEKIVPKSRDEIIEYVRSCHQISDITVRPPNTCVKIEVVFDTEGNSVVGAGFSKQCRYADRADEWNGERGFNIAFGRAIGDAVQQLTAIGNSKEAQGK